MGRKWIELEGIGKLEIEVVLVTFDVPVLFICQNEKEQRYLTMCVDEDEGIYTLVQTEKSFILQMLENKMTMEHVFRIAKNGKIFLTNYDFKNCVFGVTAHNAADFDKEYLPKEGEYFELCNDKILAYKEKLLKEDLMWQIAIARYHVLSLKYSEGSDNTVHAMDANITNQHIAKRGLLIA